VLPVRMARVLGGLPLEQYSGAWSAAVSAVVLLWVAAVAFFDHVIWQQKWRPAASRPTKSQAKRSKGGK
jgi:hypothetical protein